MGGPSEIKFKILVERSEIPQQLTESGSFSIRGLLLFTQSGDVEKGIKQNVLFVLVLVCVYYIIFLA